MIDTPDTLLLADGKFYTASEQLEFVIEPRPKDVSIFSSPVALNLTGTLRDPIVMPDASLVGTVAVASVLAAHDTWARQSVAGV